MFWIVRAAMRRIAPLAVLLAIAGRAAPARADNLAELIRQLADDDSDKVRLSAALNLTKLGDQRAVLPLAKALGNDPDKAVRGAAAVGLGKLVGDKTDPRFKKAAVAVLTQARDSDDSDFVRGKAAEALKVIGVTGTTAQVQTQPTGGAIYVNIGPMSSRTGDTAVDAKLKALMVKVANRTMSRVASNMAITWPGGAPTRAMLDAKATAGFYVDGTVNEMKVKEAGSSMMVSCKINMLLASYPDKSIFGLLNGGASVQASGSSNDLALAREDCVSAVVEDLIAKKIVPTITTKAGAP
ncbi:MAG TPA: HEAT repeat domain-containing protein [Kofleriaceae bacterium]|nr:HEAT repeat domain-containing protein [Kofleriaceae bacterium]